MRRLLRVSTGVAAVTLALVAGAARADWLMGPSPLPDATVGVRYSQQFTAAWGVGPFQWGIAPQTPITPGTFLLPDVVSVLPPGLSFSQTGLLEGTPGASGDFRFWVWFTDSTGAGGFGLVALHVRPSVAWAYSTWVPVASHVGGHHGSDWRTDLTLLNPGASVANVEIDFHGTGGTASQTASVPAGAQLMLADVVGQLGVTGSGALEVLSDQRLQATSRTYNQLSSADPCFPSGTEGQGYPSLNPADGLAEEQTAYLVGLVENTAFRANVGLVNTGPDEATALVELFDGSGNKLTDYPVILASGQWSQASEPFRTMAGRTAVDSGYAKVTVQSGFGVFAFASVIDNLTNDPTTVATPLPTVFPNDWLPVASRASGLHESQWRTDLGILNTGAAVADVSIAVPDGGDYSPSTKVSVPPHAQLMLADVLGQLGVTGSGPLFVGSGSTDVQVISRTYDQLPSTDPCFPNGTLGQEYAAIEPQNALRWEESAWLPGLVENARFRSNIGLGLPYGWLGASTSPAIVLVELFDGSGSKLTEYTVAVSFGQWAQDTQPFSTKAGQTAMDSGYAKVTVQSGSGVYAYASIVDNVTNDPTTVMMER